MKNRKGIFALLALFALVLAGVTSAAVSSDGDAADVGGGELRVGK